MEIYDFRIGESFYMAGQEWVCTDIGTRSICAIKKDKMDDSWYQGPPYCVPEMCIIDYDFDSCSPELNPQFDGTLSQDEVDEMLCPQQEDDNTDAFRKWQHSMFGITSPSEKSDAESGIQRCENKDSAVSHPRRYSGETYTQEEIEAIFGKQSSKKQHDADASVKKVKGSGHESGDTTGEE